MFIIGCIIDSDRLPLTCVESIYIFPGIGYWLIDFFIYFIYFADWLIYLSLLVSLSFIALYVIPVPIIELHCLSLRCISLHCPSALSHPSKWLCAFRGQESAGIVTSYGGVNAKDLFTCKGHGLVSEVMVVPIYESK